ncbi:MAG: glycosyltransferase [Candidatus Beckwithbacteria bacterium]
MKPTLSIILVHYHHQSVLFDCLDSIKANPPQTSYEIIVVDNDEKPKIKPALKRHYPQVIYLKSPGNIGYGAGNNLGAKQAKGKYLLILNPDTKLLANSINPLIKFLNTHPQAAVAAPLLSNSQGEIYPLQGTSLLSPLKAIFSLSFLHRLWPSNPISQSYWIKARTLTKPTQVAVVPGSAFLIKTSSFNQAGRFDENFFLYFEESDLCRRINQPLYLIPQAKLIHHWSRLTPKSTKIQTIFQASRWYYFKKHFNLFSAILVELFCRLSLSQLCLGFILLLATWLRFYRLPELMTFIGDQGHDYLLARDMVLTGRPALVGIASSVPWLYQGPLFIWLTALALKIGHFHPVAPAVMTAVLGVLAIYFIFKLSRNLMAALIMAVSPLAVVHSRLAYHISPIPLFSVLYLWALQQQSIGWSFFLSGLLLQFELTTLPLLFFTFIYLFKIKRFFWPKILVFLIPFLPKIIYDFSHGFTQTLGFIAWAGHRLISFSSLWSIKTVSHTILEYWQKFTLWNQPILAIVLGLIALIGLRRQRLLIGFILINLIGFYLHGSPSEAYFPVLFPAFALCLALGIKTIKLLPRLVIVFGFVVYSVYYLVAHQFIPYGPTLTERLSQVNLIQSQASSLPVELVNPPNISFDSYLDNYRYLLWWYQVPMAPASPLRFMISESNQTVFSLDSTIYHFPTSLLIKL